MPNPAGLTGLRARTYQHIWIKQTVSIFSCLLMDPCRCLICDLNKDSILKVLPPFNTPTLGTKPPTSHVCWRPHLNQTQCFLFMLDSLVCSYDQFWVKVTENLLTECRVWMSRGLKKREMAPITRTTTAFPARCLLQEGFLMLDWKPDPTLLIQPR